MLLQFVHLAQIEIRSTTRPACRNKDPEAIMMIRSLDISGRYTFVQCWQLATSQQASSTIYQSFSVSQLIGKAYICHKQKHTLWYIGWCMTFIALGETWPFLGTVISSSKLNTPHTLPIGFSQIIYIQVPRVLLSLFRINCRCVLFYIGYFFKEKIFLT